ncbi:MAG: hypothetical protein MOB07_30540 [Acidobacteria bacterium]|nr:hypothetical protein [Acidobacteriota bacterium]
MLPGREPTTEDFELKILGILIERSPGEFRSMSFGDLYNQTKPPRESLLEAALQLLADDGYIEIRQARKTSYGYSRFESYQKEMKLGPFIYEGGNFQIKATPTGWRRYESLKQKGLSNLGYPLANAVVRETLEKISSVLSSSSDRDFSLYYTRILEGLVRIGVRNYEDSFLRNSANHYLRGNASSSRRDCEVQFYQPFLKDMLGRDEVLAGFLFGESSFVGGRPDILTIYGIPIEAKVIYENEGKEESDLISKGIGQSSQYAALSRIAFLSVLDLRPRTGPYSQSNILNDVTVIEQPQAGGYPVHIVRVQHVCGYGPPSRVQ